MVAIRDRMQHRTPVILTLALLAACAAPAGPAPIAPIAVAPATPATPASTSTPTPTSTEVAPVRVAEAVPGTESWPGATGPTSLTPPVTPPVTPPPVNNTPAAVTVAVASVQLLQDCPDDRPAAAGLRSNDEAESMSRSPSQGKMRAPPPGCSLNLSLTNAGGRAGQLKVMRVRLLDGQGKRELATVASRTPTRWDAEGYVAWDERVAGNTTSQVAYTLADAKWKRGGAGDLYIKPYIVEVEVVIDGRKQTVRSAEFVPASHHMIQT